MENLVLDRRPTTYSVYHNADKGAALFPNQLSGNSGSKRAASFLDRRPGNSGSEKGGLVLKSTTMEERFGRVGLVLKSKTIGRCCERVGPVLKSTTIGGSPNMASCVFQINNKYQTCSKGRPMFFFARNGRLGRQTALRARAG